ncbi:pyrroline-5-carboxylate reductase [Variovorax paradoxus]|jgi:pyrroline-5-carboxylate reductase|uniref:pyrroline-5-carboxylate reductase n=1 Tax=Variovorax paradoxus TaxID=34073 RepID=UPI003AAC03B2
MQRHNTLIYMANRTSIKQVILFVGGGQMASALIGALLKDDWPADSIVVLDPSVTQRATISETFGVRTLLEPHEELGAATTVIWAVKPQVLADAMRQVLPHLSDPLHISIAAGVRSDILAQHARSDRIIRVMPNTSVLVGAGVCGMCAGRNAKSADKALAEAILTPTGYCFWVQCDDQLDAVTAVSGSGPAYVFHFMSAFQKAAQAIGFDESTSRELVLQVVGGAVKQASSSQHSFDTLQQNVTSKRGTTEAAIAVLNESGTASALNCAVRAAKERAAELADELSR